mgnify:FL=1
MAERYLSAVSWHECDACGGTGYAPPPGFHESCEVCDGAGELQGHLRPTPADLLTDPRVRSLVEALTAALGPLDEHAPVATFAVEAALAPFEVSRG